MQEYSDLEVRQPARNDPTSVPSRQPDQSQRYGELPDPSQLSKHYPSEHRRVGRWTLSGLAALLTAMVVGGAIGGGLGSSLKTCRDQKRYVLPSNIRWIETGADKTPSFSHLSSNSSLDSHSVISTITITSDSTPPHSVSSGMAIPTPVAQYLPPSPSDVASVSFNCQDGIVPESTHFSADFHVYCGTDFGTGLASTTKDSGGNTLNYIDILGVIAYSTSLCMQACLELNNWGESLDRPSADYCRAIHFSAELSSAVGQLGANCWLKNGTPADAGSVPVGDTSTGLSATLEQN